MKKLPLIIITGPTAVGKTDLSIRLAKRIGGEIISADSMQVYRYMNIGSAKVSAEEMDGVPHYLIDVLNPTEEFNVVTFQHMAEDALKTIYSHGSVPIVAGGTGFYIQALLYHIDFKENPEGSTIRNELEQLAKEKGCDALHQRLFCVDPESALTIHPHNQKRVIRALEYFYQTGEKISSHNQEERLKCSPYNFLYYVINMNRNELYQRIEKRVDQMMENGLIEEVKELKAMGCCRSMTSMQGLGYKEILDYLNGSSSLEDSIYRLKRDTRHFAKRQLTWFKREREVRWINVSEFNNDKGKILDHILQEIKERRMIDEYRRNLPTARN